MNIRKIGSFEAIALVCIVITNQILLNIPETIIQQSGSSAWINVIFISIVAITFTVIVCKLFERFTGKDILDVSEYVGGSTLKFIIGFVYIVIIILISATLLGYFSESLKIIYFHNTPSILIISIFLTAAILANHAGTKAISNINTIILPIGLIAMLIIFISTIKNFEYERLFPIFGYGINSTFYTGMSNIFSYGGIAFLYFLMPFLKNYNEFKKVSIISIIISSIYLLMSVISMLLVFSYVSSSDQTIAIYSLTRTIEYGRFFQRIDAIFILIWILLVMSCISILISLGINIFKKITNIGNSKELIFPFAIFIFSISLLINNVSIGRYIYEVVFKYFELVLVFGISFIILIIGNIKSKQRKSEAANHE